MPLRKDPASFFRVIKVRKRQQLASLSIIQRSVGYTVVEVILQLEFGQLQKKRMPQLGKAEFLDLFHVWRDHYLAKLEAELAATRKRMAENDCQLAALIAERQRLSPAANQFVCKCGEIIADPFDPEQLRIHGPHFVAASLP